MKRLSKFIQEEIDGMGAVKHGDVATSPSDTFSSDFKHGSGDITSKKKKPYQHKPSGKKEETSEE